MDHYDLLLAVVAAVTLAATALPLLLVGRPLSFPLAYIGLGLVLFSLPMDLRGRTRSPTVHSSSGSASWQ